MRIAAKANSGIKGIADLNGKTVATTTGTTSVQLLRKNKRAAGIDFKELYGKDHADSFLLLESGRADAFVMDGQILAGLISKSKNPADYKIVGEVLSVEPIAIMFRKDDPAFKKAVDDSVRGMAKSGEVAKLYDKWFMQPIPPSQHQGRPAGVARPPRRRGRTRTTSRLEDYARRSDRGVRAPEVSPSAGAARSLLTLRTARRGAIRVALVSCAVPRCDGPSTAQGA